MDDDKSDVFWARILGWQHWGGGLSLIVATLAPLSREPYATARQFVLGSLGPKQGVWGLRTVNSAWHGFTKGVLDRKLHLHLLTFLC